MEEIKTNNQRLYQCDICGKIENWTNEWEWFGSYIDQEEGEPILYTCSSKCRGSITELTAKNLLNQKKKKNRFKQVET